MRATSASESRSRSESTLRKSFPINVLAIPENVRRAESLSEPCVQQHGVVGLRSAIAQEHAGHRGAILRAAKVLSKATYPLTGLVSHPLASFLKREIREEEVRKGEVGSVWQASQVVHCWEETYPGAARANAQTAQGYRAAS